MTVNNYPAMCVVALYHSESTYSVLLAVWWQLKQTCSSITPDAVRQCQCDQAARTRNKYLSEGDVFYARHTSDMGNYLAKSWRRGGCIPLVHKKFIYIFAKNIYFCGN
jgi:hypothetical protein